MPFLNIACQHVLRQTAPHRKRSRSSLPTIFNDEFLAITLPSLAHFPLTDFTGPQDNITVLISKNVPQPTADSLICEETEESIDSLQEPPEFPFECVQVVCVGHQASGCMYLPSSHPPPSNWPTNQIHSFQKANISELTPLSLDKARYIASLYSLNAKNSASLPNLWILCSSEKQRIISIGCSFVGSVLHTYSIRSGDAVKISSLEASKRSGAVVKHPSYSPGAVFSQYTITGSSRRDEEGAGSLTVEFSWSDAEKSLCPPSEGAEALVRVSAVPGYIFSPVLATYNELCTLLTFCKIAAGKSEWPSQEAPCDGGSTPEMLQRIETFLSEVASPLTAQSLDATIISPTADNNIYEMRKNLDFCERLWFFAKDASSLDNLLEIFAAIFKALLLGRVQPFVHRNSLSPLSLLLRQLLQCTSAEERQALAPHFQSFLSPSKLLSCLIDTGLEKLKRDYCAFFVSSDIVTEDQLDEFLTESLPHSQLKRCHTLCKLHCALEINASLLSFLNLPSSSLSSLTKAALQVYQDVTFDEFRATPVFSLPLPPYSAALKSLITLCGKLSPTLWIALPSKEKTLVMYRSEPVHGRSEDRDSYYVYHARYDTSRV